MIICQECDKPTKSALICQICHDEFCSEDCLVVHMRRMEMEESDEDN